MQNKKQIAYYKLVNSDTASNLSCAVIRLPFLQFFSTLIMQSKFVAIFVCFCVFREICLSLELHGAVVLLVIPRLDFYHHVQHAWWTPVWSTTFWRSWISLSLSFQLPKPSSATPCFLFAQPSLLFTGWQWKVIGILQSCNGWPLLVMIYPVNIWIFLVMRQRSRLTISHHWCHQLQLACVRVALVIRLTILIVVELLFWCKFWGFFLLKNVI